MSLLLVFFSVKAQKEHAVNHHLDSLITEAKSQWAALNYFHSLKLAEEVKKLASASNEKYYLALAEDHIAGTYTNLYDFVKSEQHQLKSIEYSAAIQDTFLLTLGYSNLAHAYMLEDDIENSNKSIKTAEKLNVDNKYNTGLYLYETKVMSLYKQKLYDSIVVVSELGLKQLEYEKNKRLLDPNFVPSDWRNMMDERLKITFELFKAYGLLEVNRNSELANSLLNKHKDKKLEDLLYMSVRVYKNYYRINTYKEQYFLSLSGDNYDSINYYKERRNQYYYKTIEYLRKSSIYRNNFLEQAVASENEAERLKLITENKNKENELNGRLIYLLGFLALFALAFVVHYYMANTKIKIVNASLDQANSDLKKMYLNRDRFLALVSNEIRTPLYTLEQLIASVPVNEYEIEEELILANYSLINLRHSIDNSLQYSQLNYFDSKKYLINRPVNLKDILEEIPDNFRSILIANDVDFQVIYNGENYIFDLEKSKLLLVINNLVKNAIEKEDVTSVEVKVIEIPISQVESLLTFSVIDNAAVISKEDLEYIENGKFVIEDENINKGIKLGLILSNQLLALYNSKLKFSGNYQRNLVSFDIKLKASNKAKLVSNFTKLKKCNVLYVDNSDSDLNVIHKIIGSLNYTCDTVRSDSALTSLANKSYDVIIVAVDSLEADYKSTRALRNYNKSIPIIAITSLVKEDILKDCVECRINDVLTKPVDLNQLGNTLIKYV